MRLIANISLLFTEHPLPERFAAAARAGFDGVEIQFPYDHEPEALRRAAGTLPVVLINAPASDPRGGVGRATDAALVGAFAEGLAQAERYAAALRVEAVNVLPGPPPPGQSAELSRDTLAANLGLAADRLGPLGVTVVTEPINPFDRPGFFLAGLGPALAFLDGLADPRIKLQFDLYHMSRTEPDLVAAIAAAGARIGHVQFADDPGRHEPGTGRLDFAAAFRAFAATDYSGAVAAEYLPAARTEDGLGWMPAIRAMLRV